MMESSSSFYIIRCTSGGFRGDSRSSLEPPSGAKLFHFHEEFQENLCKRRQTKPLFLHLNPIFRNPGSAPGVLIIVSFLCCLL